MLNRKTLTLVSNKEEIRNDLQTTFNASAGFHRIVDIVESPYSNLTSFVPYAPKDENWNSNHPDPTPQEYFNQYILEKGEKLSDLSDINDVMIPALEDWVSIDKIYINDEGLQRNQLKNRKTARNIWKNAINFRYTMALVQCQYIDIPGHQLDGCYFAWDGGGTVTSAALRSSEIKKLPVRVTRVTDPENIGADFYELANSVESVVGEETFKRKYYLEDPMALLQGKIYKTTDTTPIHDHPNRELKELALTALKKMLEETFSNTNKTSISGDTKDIVKSTKHFSDRKCKNIIDVLEVIQTNWSDESPVVPAVFKEFTRFYATVDSIITLRRFNQMICDYKNGDITIKGSDIHPNCVQGKIDWSSQKKVSDGLALQSNTDFHKSYGTYVLAKCWNHWVNGKYGYETIDEKFLTNILHNGKSYAQHYDNKSTSSLL